MYNLRVYGAVCGHGGALYSRQVLFFPFKPYYIQVQFTHSLQDMLEKGSIQEPHWNNEFVVTATAFPTEEMAFFCIFQTDADFR